MYLRYFFNTYIRIKFNKNFPTVYVIFSSYLQFYLQNSIYLC